MDPYYSSIMVYDLEWLMEKIDRLFLEKDCPHCSMIRAEIVTSAVSNDDFRGNDGQKFLVFSALSNEASMELLDSFGFKGKHMPLLQTHDGEIRTETNHILGWLRVNKMAAHR